MFTRPILLAAVGLAALFSTTGVAQADAGQVVSSIREGNTGTPVGTANFDRSMNNDGTETLTISFQVVGGMSSDQLCLSHSAFTSRVTQPTCPDRYDQHPSLNGATTDQFTMNVGTDYVNEPIYVQLHIGVANPAGTAFAGWQSGNPFYGNVQVDSTPVEGVPAAPLLGSWMPIGLGGLFVFGMGAMGWRYRRRLTATDTVH